MFPHLSIKYRKYLMVSSWNHHHRITLIQRHLITFYPSIDWRCLERTMVQNSQMTQHYTMVQNSLKYRLQYWATHLSDRSFVRTTHSFACSGLLASLAPSAALTRWLAHSLARSLTSLTPSLMGKWMIRWLFIVFFYSGPKCITRSRHGTTFPLRMEIW